MSDKVNFPTGFCSFLVVEDSPTQAQRLQFLLEQNSCNVAIATDGEQALQMISENRPDVVISDVVMPGMDGFELCQRIKRDPEFTEIPVVLLTSLDNPHDIIKGLDAGASNFITKPYDKEYLFSCLQAIMMNKKLESHEGMQVGVDIFFAGKRHKITAERRQILALLLSTFETAVNKNNELLKAEAELRKLNEQLEEKVRLRTENLTAEVAERRRLEAEHADLARKLELVLDSAGEGIFGVDSSFRCTFVNATAAELLGYAPQELQGSDMRAILQPVASNQNGYQPQCAPISSDDFSLKPVRKAKATFRRRDGTCFPARYTANQMVQDQRPVGLVVTFMDISDEIAAERKLETQLSRLDALHNIDLSITASLDLHLTLETVLKMCQRELEIDVAIIHLLDKESKMLNYFVGRGFSSQALAGTSIPMNDAIFTSGSTKPLDRIANNHDIKGSRYSAGKEDFEGYYRLPLSTKGQPCGILEFFSRRPLNPSEAWIEYAQTLARHAMIAIDNYQLLSSLEKSNADLTHAYEATIEGWSRAMDLRDHETEGHTQRVAAITLYLARRMGYHDRDLVHIRHGALLHDIGKIGIPDSILLKPGSLTEEEWEIMRKHPQYAHDLLYPISYLRHAIDIPYCHHEKWDGTGYPRGLKGAEIPQAARIFAVADIWDALQSDRPYRAAWEPAKIREHICSLSGHHLEPKVVEAFLEIDLQQLGAVINAPIDSDKQRKTIV